MTIKATIYYFLLFGLMFTCTPFGFSPFEIPKVALTFMLTLILILTLCYEFIVKKQSIFSLYSPKLLFFIPFTTIAFYHLLNPGPFLNLAWANPSRIQGTYLYLTLFILFLISTPKFLNKEFLSRAAFYSLIALPPLTLLIGPRAGFRFIGPLGEPNSLGAVVLFLLPLFFLFRSTLKQKVIVLILSIVLVLLSGSRSTLLGLIAELILLPITNKSKLFALFALTVILGLLLSFYFPFLPKPAPRDVNQTFESRQDIWEVSYLGGIKYQQFGAGFGSTEEVIHKQAKLMKNLLEGQTIDDPHNLFLNFWISEGNIGFALFVLLIFISFYNFYTKSKILFITLLSLIYVQSFNPVSIATLAQFWILLGIGVGSIDTL